MRHKFKFMLLAFAALCASAVVVSCGSDDDEITPDIPETPTVPPISAYGKYNGVTYFKYPVMDWGASVSDVKKKMSGFTLSKETSTSVTYDGKYKELATLYQFEANRLKTASVGIRTSAISATALTSILQKDFTYIGTDDDDLLYLINSEHQLGCAVGVRGSGTSTYYLMVWLSLKSLDTANSRATGDETIQYLRNCYKERQAVYVLE